MKISFKAIATFVLIVFGTLASGAAMAEHRGGGARFGFYFGVPMYAPWYYPSYYPAYYPPPYYYPPVAVVPYSPPVYIEQSTAQTAPAQTQSQGDWYYCAASKSYYPYVGECPAGWQRVPAQPPSH